MKKIIKILQENIEPLILEDENDDDLNEYIQNLSKLLSVGNVSILETSKSSLIIRPHQIVSIIVTEEGIPKRKYTKKILSNEKVETKTEPIQEDIITDG